MKTQGMTAGGGKDFLLWADLSLKQCSQVCHQALIVYDQPALILNSSHALSRLPNSPPPVIRLLQVSRDMHELTPLMHDRVAR